MAEWHYHNPVEIQFGPGSIDKLPGFVTGKALLLTTPGTTRRGISQKISELLGPSLVSLFDNVEPNPTFETITGVFRELSKIQYDVIIAVGGGSAIDTAKTVTAIEAAGSEDWIDEHLKYNTPIPPIFNPKPVIAIPTTAGTGSEVTMWATIWDMREKRKYSLSHTKLYPKLAVLDPDLTLSLPEKETIYSGLDALSHAMESIWNKNHNPVSDTFALKAIELVRKHLPELRENQANIYLRTLLLRASLFAGLAFSNTKTALAHSISYALTTHFGFPHGLACSLPLPHILRFNNERVPDRVGIIAKALGTQCTSASMITEIVRLFDRLGLYHKLEDYGVDSGSLELILKSAFTPGRADNNIIGFEQSDLSQLISYLFK